MQQTPLDSARPRRAGQLAEALALHHRELARIPVHQAPHNASTAAGVSIANAGQGSSRQPVRCHVYASAAHDAVASLRWQIRFQDWIHLLGLFGATTRVAPRRCSQVIGTSRDACERSIAGPRPRCDLLSHRRTGAGSHGGDPATGRNRASAAGHWSASSFGKAAIAVLRGA